MGVSAELDDLLGPQTVDRLETELRSALRRKPANETRLGGALQLLAPYSDRLREAMLAALDLLVHRGAYLRPLYLFILRGLIACREQRVTPLLCKALSLEDGAGLGTLAAAAMCTQSGIGAPLVKLAASRSPHLSFAGELARIARGESTGHGLTASALRIKESHRLQVVNCLVLPLVRERQICTGAQAGIRVLRDAERHLGRWLLFGELAQLCGDSSPLVTARERVAKGPISARSLQAVFLCETSDLAKRRKDSFSRKVFVEFQYQVRPLGIGCPYLRNQMRQVHGRGLSSLRMRAGSVHRCSSTC